MPALFCECKKMTAAQHYTTNLSKAQGMVPETLELLELWEPGMSVVELKDGRALNALVAAKSERTLTLKTMTETLTVERSDIAGITESALSLMPEGLLDALPHEPAREPQRRGADDDQHAGAERDHEAPRKTRRVRYVDADHRAVVAAGDDPVIRE